jgi:hypothetical protein
MLRKWSALFCERLNWALIVSLEKSGRNTMGVRDFIKGIADLFSKECSTTTAAIKVLRVNELTISQPLKESTKYLIEKSRRIHE